MLSVVQLSVLVMLPKTFWLRLLDSIVIQLYTCECMPSVDRAESSTFLTFSYYLFAVSTVWFLTFMRKCFNFSSALLKIICYMNITMTGFESRVDKASSWI